ncbi:2-hydroxyacid dehydrogenase [Chelatococcus reniformis]|uniref:Glycerate dehydrogenase n=1 Tax=Chelatococcus reniformis TaxID=1494448 RepID=A0A916TWH7_9HYPH|nr:NAD(P)-dependent oxidoreductase [Chelatococcus reniformis]GGC46950.1 glycerate dehydrogenase [Chelatococcus reniformis]
MLTVFVDRTPEMREIMERAGLPPVTGMRIHEGDPDTATLAAIATEAECLIVDHTIIPAALIETAPRLKGIVFLGTGASTYIDLAAAERRGIPVATIRGYGDQAVAEHAIALMFAAARRIAAMDRGIRGGIWHPTGGIQLAGRKVTVVGLGGIGTAFARMAHGLGMTIAGWNRTPQPKSPFFEADLDTALTGADVVAVHLALNDGTRHLIDARRLALPKRGFLLINTARAAIVDQEAMRAALDDGQIGHAGLDVFSREPLPADDPLTSRSDVTLTAHAAFMTDEAHLVLWQRALEQAARIAAGRGIAP